MKNLIFFISICFILLSCGNNAEKKPKAQEMNDAINSHYDEQQRFIEEHDIHIENAKKFTQVGAVEEANIELEAAQKTMKEMEKRDSLWQIEFDKKFKN